MCTGLVLLADGAAGDKVVDEYRKPRPPKIAFNNSLGAKVSEVAQEGGGMDGVEERGSGGGRHVPPPFIVQMSVVESLVRK